jgi:hypothetical protein
MNKMATTLVVAIAVATAAIANAIIGGGGRRGIEH